MFPSQVVISVQRTARLKVEFCDNKLPLSCPGQLTSKGTPPVLIALIIAILLEMSDCETLPVHVQWANAVRCDVTKASVWLKKLGFCWQLGIVFVDQVNVSSSEVAGWVHLTRDAWRIQNQNVVLLLTSLSRSQANCFVLMIHTAKRDTLPTAKILFTEAGRLTTRRCCYTIPLLCSVSAGIHLGAMDCGSGAVGAHDGYLPLRRCGRQRSATGRKRQSHQRQPRLVHKTFPVIRFRLSWTGSCLFFGAIGNTTRNVATTFAVKGVVEMIANFSLVEDNRSDKQTRNVFICHELKNCAFYEDVSKYSENQHVHWCANWHGWLTWDKSWLAESIVLCRDPWTCWVSEYLDTSSYHWNGVVRCALILLIGMMMRPMPDQWTKLIRFEQGSRSSYKIFMDHIQAYLDRKYDLHTRKGKFLQNPSANSCCVL